MLILLELVRQALNVGKVVHLYFAARLQDPASTLLKLWPTLREVEGFDELWEMSSQACTVIRARLHVTPPIELRVLLLR